MTKSSLKRDNLQLASTNISFMASFYRSFLEFQLFRRCQTCFRRRRATNRIEDIRDQGLEVESDERASKTHLASAMERRKLIDHISNPGVLEKDTKRPLATTPKFATNSRRRCFAGAIQCNRTIFKRETLFSNTKRRDCCDRTILTRRY